MRNLSRRGFLGVLGGLAVACQGVSATAPTPRASAPMVASDGNAPDPGAPAPSAPPPTPASTAAPRPTGTEERLLLPDTPWATRAVVRHSGLAGPAAIVLGGVHGNEPGGWDAAEAVAEWQPTRGSLVVVPRANALAIPQFVRTTEVLGDLNRLYPGDPDGQYPMERMAAAIVAAAREFGAEFLLDMHESWAFYVDAPGTGTAALGQTVTPGVGPRQADLGAAIAAKVNPLVTPREQLIIRDGTSFRRPDSSGTPSGRGRSSLSMGGHVPGLTPLLAEMGQQGQPVARRVELHLLVARAALETVGVL